MVKIPASSAEGTPSIPDQGIKILNAEQWSQKLKKKKVQSLLMISYVFSDAHCSIIYHNKKTRS